MEAHPARATAKRWPFSEVQNVGKLKKANLCAWPWLYFWMNSLVDFRKTKYTRQRFFRSFSLFLLFSTVCRFSAVILSYKNTNKKLPIVIIQMSRCFHPQPKNEFPFFSTLHPPHPYHTVFLLLFLASYILSSPYASFVPPQNIYWRSWRKVSYDVHPSWTPPPTQGLMKTAFVLTILTLLHARRHLVELNEKRVGFCTLGMGGGDEEKIFKTGPGG